MKNVKNNIKRSVAELSLESRILIITSLVGMLFSFTAAIGNYLLDAGIVPTLAPLFMGLITFYFFYLAYFKKKYILPVYGALLLLTLIFIPLLWIYNGGLSSSIPFFYLFIIGLSAILLNKLKYKLILGIQIAVLTALLSIEFYYPDSIIKYNSETAVFIDKAIALIIIGFTMFIMLIKIMKEYHRTIDKLRVAQEKLKKSNDVLYQASITDDLTGLYNRGRIIELLSGLIESGGQQKGISIVMMDIDHFKKINDTYGHQVGDLVLTKISASIRKHFRNTDFIGRIGGEEFLILMPDTKLETAFKRAEDIRKYIEGLKWDYAQLHVTISGGIYNFSESESCDTALNKVDIALYQAKSSGRNLIKSYC
ncbi:MAG TPA: GGDEF domain-containing protein [Desulfitobacteriaceae bacterium]|nr:GGDEF domain-containing protein [Desulfitobacteriaceae bacterium]